MLAQFEWSRVAELTTVCVPLFGVPLTVMCLYLRSLRSDVRASLIALQQRVDGLDGRLIEVERHKVGRRDFVLKAARTNGKIEQLFDRIGEVKNLVHEVRGRIDGEVGVGRKIEEAAQSINQGTSRLAAALKEERPS